MSTYNIKKTPDVENFEKDLDSMLTNYDYNDQKHIFQFGTIREKDSTEWDLGNAYNLLPQHGHTIIGYDSQNKIVKVANPHNYAVTTDIPLSILTKFISRLNITNL